MEAAYSFTIPSVEDDTPLDCRIYHPGDLHQFLTDEKPSNRTLHGALIAHPYAPLGGCYDDPVVLSVAEALVHSGYIVGTFNFRGAAGSAGHTSWSARGEKDDYITFAGFMTYYLQYLAQRIVHMSTGDLSPMAPYCRPFDGTRLLLAGYSYGSLILCKIPPLPTIIERFEAAAVGTSAAEVILRARRLAAETIQTAQDVEVKARGRPDSATSPPQSPARSRAHSTTIRLGGEETHPSERRHSRGSRDGRRGFDLVKKGVEVPHRIKMHIRKRSSTKFAADRADLGQDSKAQDVQIISVRYLLISPLMPPLSYTLVPPTHLARVFSQSELKDPSTGFGLLDKPTLMIWGSQDGFTSSKKLKAWTDKLSDVSTGHLENDAVQGAGHFWREPGVMKQLLTKVIQWNLAHDESSSTMTDV